MPGGLGSGRAIALILAAVLFLWAITGFYRVQEDEQGVVLRFGEWVYTTTPGLRYHLPTPIESVIRPKVTRVNRVDVGYRSVGEASARQSSVRDVSEESLMLTGDENIVDMDFTVLWKIGDAGKFLFIIRDPEETVKVASESAMREVVGQSSFDNAVTIGRQDIEQRTAELLQRILDDYQSGILILSVQLQKVDPPSEVIDAFNDVQRARQDKDRLRNEAESYANAVVPKARGDAERKIQEASAYKERAVLEADGEAQHTWRRWA
jgi:membrane protease subunit HflK